MRKTQIPGYWRKKMYTRPHVRHLSEGMQVELADAQRGLINEQFFYYAVPDPTNTGNPVYVREDLLLNMPQSEYVKFIRYITPFNDPKQLALLISRRLNFMTTGGLQEALMLSDFWDSIGSLIQTGIGVASLAIPGGNIIGSVLGAIGGSTGTGGTTTQPPVTTTPPPAPSPGGIVSQKWVDNGDGTTSLIKTYSDGSTTKTTYPKAPDIPESEKQVIDAIIAYSNNSSLSLIEKQSYIQNLISKGIVDLPKKIGWIALAVAKGEISIDVFFPPMQAMINDYIKNSGTISSTPATILSHIFGTSSTNAGIGGTTFGLPNLIAYPAIGYGAYKLYKQFF